MHTTNDNEGYVCHEPMTAREVLQKASEIIAQRYARQSEPFTSPTLTKEYLQLKLSHYEREVFGIMLLDSQHRLIEFKELFQGTINAANVYPREVVKVVIQANAAAVILTHNHPSGLPEPSQADIYLCFWYGHRTRMSGSLRHRKPFGPQAAPTTHRAKALDAFRKSRQLHILLPSG